MTAASLGDSRAEIFQGFLEFDFWGGVSHEGRPLQRERGWYDARVGIKSAVAAAIGAGRTEASRAGRGRGAGRSRRAMHSARDVASTAAKRRAGLPKSARSASPVLEALDAAAGGDHRSMNLPAASPFLPSFFAFASPRGRVREVEGRSIAPTRAAKSGKSFHNPEQDAVKRSKAIAARRGAGRYRQNGERLGREACGAGIARTRRLWRRQAPAKQWRPARAHDAPRDAVWT